jgi:type I restriction enzyme S subunit
MENIKPSVRFPEFTENWNETKFKKHFEFKNTNSLSRENLNYESGKVKNIHYGDIHTKFDTHFDINKEELPFINDSVDISRIDDENYVLNGDLVMADASEDYADIGKTIEITNTNNEKILAGLHTFLARKTDNTLAKGFFGHLLTTYKARIELMTIAQGTKVLGLSKGRVEKIDLFIPKPLEQQKIASSLTTTDNRINLLKEKKEALVDYKKGVMQKLFNQDIRFKEDNGNDFPDWEEKVLGKVFSGLKGKGISKDKIVENGENECILYGELYTTYNETIAEVVSTTNSNEGVKSKKGDLLIPASTTTTGIDLANVTSILKEDVLLGGDINILRKNEKLNSAFFAYYLSNHYKTTLAKYAQGITIVHLYFSHLKKIKILVPKLEEQDIIASYLSALDTKIDALQQKIEISVDFKKGLLQKMFV